MRAKEYGSNEVSLVGNLSLKKSDTVSIKGAMYNDSYNDKAGNKRQVQKVEATSLEQVERYSATGNTSAAPATPKVVPVKQSAPAPQTQPRSGSLEIDQGLIDFPVDNELPF